LSHVIFSAIRVTENEFLVLGRIISTPVAISARSLYMVHLRSMPWTNRGKKQSECDQFHTL